MATKTLEKFVIGQKTRNVLANFAAINQSLKFAPGKELRTCSAHKTMFATAQIEEEIPLEFSIHDLSKFLSVLSTYNMPAMVFTGNDVISIFDPSDTSRRYRYRTCSENMILSPGKSDIEIDNPIVTFNITKQQIASLVKTLSISKHPTVKFLSEKGKIIMRGIDPAGANSDVYEQILGNTDVTFDTQYELEKMSKLLQADYKVSLTDIFICFDGSDVKYFFAPDAETD